MIFDFKSFSRWLAVTAAISACATKIHGPTTADAFALRPVTSSSNARSLSRTATIGLPRTSTIASTSTTATQQQQQQQQPRPLTIMYRIRCENKYYQLEELEDADNCTTELFLKHDGTVDVMETDGPLFSKAVGNWEIKENQFAMTITKTFATGTNNKSDPTGMGEFTFAVERVFEGEMTVVGGTEVAINGRIFAEDIVTDKMEKEVGFFNMIDGTEQRLERRADARPKNTGVLPSPIDSNDVKGHNGIPSEWVEPVAQQDAWLEEPQQQQQQQEWAEPQQQQEWAEPQQEWEQQQQQQQQQQAVAGTTGDNNIGKNNYDFEYNYNVSMNRDVASVISCIGNVKNRVGELDAALTKYLQALQIYKSIHERHSSTGNNSGNINSSNNNNNDHVEALRDVTATLKVIGMVHAKRGDLDTAMQFFREAMALLRAYEDSVDEPDKDRNKDNNDNNIDNSKKKDTINNNNSNNNNANTLTIRETKASILTRIASIHLKKGELDDAMASYRQAYDLTVQNRGNTTNHPEIAGILHYIGGIYHKRGEYDEAMSCYQESIRIYHATLGTDHPTVAGTLVMVGSIHYKRRHLDSAMMFYREALRLNRDAYGMHHPDVAPILKSIGTILTKKGEYHEAFDLFRDVLNVKVTVHGTDHPEVASAYKSLGNVHYKLGELGDAERQYRHALSIYRKSKGDDHPDTVGAKTTIEHLRYWMRERDQLKRQQQQQQQDQRRGDCWGSAKHTDEHSC